MIRNSFILCAFLFFSINLFAAEIVKVKGAAALIDLKGDPAAPGDTFYALKSDGKRSAVIRISKMKGSDQAIAKILKGKATVGMTLEPRPEPTAKSSSGSKKSASSSSGAKRSYWGGLFGYAQDSMTAKVYDAAGTYLKTVELTGSAFSGKGLFDYELIPQLWFRGTAGLEGFNVTGAAACGTANNTACDAKIWYLSFDFIGRYVFTNGTVRPWLGGGASLLFPASKSATALNSSSITTTSVYMIGGGIDWHLSPTMYIPLSIEYGLLPKSDEVEATWIAFRAGFAVPF